MMKKIVITAAMILLGVFGLTACNSTNAGKAAVSSQFDLTEQKEYWSGSIEDDFEDDRVVVIMKKTSTYPELELKHFRLDNADSLHYYFLRANRYKPKFPSITSYLFERKGQRTSCFSNKQVKQIGLYQNSNA